MKPVHPRYQEIGEIEDLVRELRSKSYDLNNTVGQIHLGFGTKEIVERSESQYADLRQIFKSLNARMSELDRKLADDS